MSGAPIHDWLSGAGDITQSTNTRDKICMKVVTGEEGTSLTMQCKTSIICKVWKIVKYFSVRFQRFTKSLWSLKLSM